MTSGKSLTIGTTVSPPISHTDEPAVVLRESGQSRTAWLAGDVERTYWITGHGDLLRLLHNTIRWITRDETPVRVGSHRRDKAPPDLAPYAIPQVLDIGIAIADASANAAIWLGTIILALMFIFL